MSYHPPFKNWLSLPHFGPTFAVKRHFWHEQYQKAAFYSNPPPQEPLHLPSQLLSLTSVTALRREWQDFQGTKKTRIWTLLIKHNHSVLSTLRTSCSSNKEVRDPHVETQSVTAKFPGFSLQQEQRLLLYLLHVHGTASPRHSRSSEQRHSHTGSVCRSVCTDEARQHLTDLPLIPRSVLHQPPCAPQPQSLRLLPAKPQLHKQPCTTKGFSAWGLNCHWGLLSLA